MERIWNVIDNYFLTKKKNRQLCERNFFKFSYKLFDEEILDYILQINIFYSRRGWKRYEVENVRVNSHINKVCCLLKVVCGPQGRMGFLVFQ